jgi:hypothetical protein
MDGRDLLTPHPRPVGTGPFLLRRGSERVAMSEDDEGEGWMP